MTIAFRFTLRGKLGTYDVRVVDDGVAELLCGGWDVHVTRRELPSLGEVHAACEPTPAAAKREARKIVRRLEQQQGARAFCEGVGGQWLKSRTRVANVEETGEKGT